MIVVDASVALSWVLPDTEANHRYSADVAEAGLTGKKRLIVPLIFQAECSYVLLKRGRAARWGDALIGEYAELIDWFSLETHVVVQDIAPQVRFAARYNVQGYDALYLALAMQTGATLATVDGGLKTAARIAGVELFQADAIKRP